MSVEKRIHIFLSGSVGVGKTTALKAFLDVYAPLVNCIVIQEYIDYDDEGEAKFNQWIDGKLTLLEFQMYILDCFEAQLDSPLYHCAKVCIWERHPQEALEIFAKDLPIIQKMKFMERLKKLSEMYEFPLLDTGKRKEFNKITFNTLDVSDMFIADVLYDTIRATLCKEAATNLPLGFYIFLYIPNNCVDSQYDRIVKRGRVHEIERYKNVHALIDVNNQYQEFMDTFKK